MPDITTTVTGWRPMYPEIHLNLDLYLTGRPDNELLLIDTVSRALERAGHPAAAATFADLAAALPTIEDLIDLVRCTITTI